MKKLFALALTGYFLLFAQAQNGYDLWMKYYPITGFTEQQHYRTLLQGVSFEAGNPTQEAAFYEIAQAAGKMLQIQVNPQQKGNIILTKNNPALSASLQESLKGLPAEGYIIQYNHHRRRPSLIIAANDDAGLLYGSFRLLKEIQSGSFLQRSLTIIDYPAIQHRILNHWDNLDRTVERGYAGFSLWNWHTLPDIIEPRYIDYARANASIGINVVVLTNVNANALILTPQYLKKVQALADAFRPYNIRVALTARFSAPKEIGGISTADPLNDSVQNWWNNKTAEIYRYIPDFAGYLVKANSEGQPGPQDYQRTHADGANMLARAIAPYNGIVMWRAFVYSNETPEDRFKQAYNEFKPLDGSFEPNVLVQVKNGPIDFQPREPFHPLFGAMPKTPLMMEFQITQEYLGMATHAAYLAPMFKEVLDSPTYRPDRNATVARIITGEQDQHPISAIAGVANIGNDVNWTGHPLAQANWYAYGRLAWNPQLSSEEILDEWINQTYILSPEAHDVLADIMMQSRETLVKYMTPLGLHHIMGWSHHFGPAPWIANMHRADWTSVYYHKADEYGIGFDRTATGSDALAQYAPEVAALYSNPKTCPEEFLLWFHRLAWDDTLSNGETVWNSLCLKYQEGVDEMAGLLEDFEIVAEDIPSATANHLRQLLTVQYQEAIWWKDACLAYFHQFSKRPYPAGVTPPEHDLEYYKNKQRELRFVPGI